MRVWSISSSSGGSYTLLLEDAKPQALFVGWAWDRLCGLSGGRLGGHGPSDWPWKVPLGVPDRDPEDGMLKNSLAGRLHDLEQWALTFGYPTPEKVERVPLTHDQAMQIDPKFTTEWDSMYDEEDDQLTVVELVGVSLHVDREGGALGIAEAPHPTESDEGHEVVRREGIEPPTR